MKLFKIYVINFYSRPVRKINSYTLYVGPETKVENFTGKPTVQTRKMASISVEDVDFLGT